MRRIMALGLVADKIVRIPVLALLSHFSDSPDNEDVASQYLSQAMQHAISLGLHIERHYQTDAENYSITLFCSLWALDRMNAAFGGRPVMMHAIDIGRDLKQCFQAQKPAFRLLLEVTLLLDKVIGLYRPSFGEEAERLELEFPSFEEIAVSCTSQHVTTNFLGTYTCIFCHVVCSWR
jgi:hypothetical protein